MGKPSFSVLWTEAAARDLVNIVEYIAVDSEAGAEKVKSRIHKKAESLKSVPNRGRIVPELAVHGLSAWRELIVKPYRLVYRFDKDEVYVLGVFDGRRDLEDLLLERLTRPTE